MLRRITRVKRATPVVRRTATALCWLVPAVGLISGSGWFAEHVLVLFQQSQSRWRFFLPALGLAVLIPRVMGFNRIATTVCWLVPVVFFFLGRELALSVLEVRRDWELRMLLFLPALAWALLITLLFGLNGNRLAYSWAYGIPQRQLAEHFATVPAMGSHMARIVCSAWKSTFVRYALPSLLFLLDYAVGLTASGPPSSMWWFLVPTMLAAYCTQPLLIGASGRTRSWGFLSVAIPMILIVVQMISMTNWETFWQPGPVVITVVCHGAFLSLLVRHLRHHQADWEVQLREFCHEED
jgi:hypothetical protein